MYFVLQREHFGKIHERFRGCLEFSKYVTSNNSDKEYEEKFQRGGTMITSSGPICARVIETGKDKRSLGRWSWIFLQGTKVMTMIIITIYQPVYSTGALSTYQQQKASLLQEGIHKLPRENILKELGQQIKEWFGQGHKCLFVEISMMTLEGTK
jgi:hypothetical protein